jgi:hypothetical protein
MTVLTENVKSRNNMNNTLVKENELCILDSTNRIEKREETGTYGSSPLQLSELTG